MKLLPIGHGVSRPVTFADTGLQRRIHAGIAMTTLLGSATWLLIVIGYRMIGFSVDIGDVHGYIRWSYHLPRHVDYPSHMPAFPALILMARLFTFHQIADAALAQVIVYSSWLIGVFLARQILQRIAPQATVPGLLLFGLFPMVGVASAAYPDAMLLGYACALGAMLLALQKRWWSFTATTAVGLLVHQAFYSFYLALALVCFFWMGMRWRHLVACGIPFTIYYVAVAVSRGDANWILGYYASHTIHGGGLPVFDGILGTMLRRTPKDLAKGVLLAVAGISACLLAIDRLHKRDWVLLSLCVPVILFAVLSPQNASFLILRLAKLLVFPASIWLADRRGLLSALESPLGYVVAAAVLVVSQFAWSYYIVGFFRA